MQYCWTVSGGLHWILTAIESLQICGFLLGTAHKPVLERLSHHGTLDKLSRIVKPLVLVGLEC